jgi:hypothetical protein
VKQKQKLSSLNQMHTLALPPYGGCISFRPTLFFQAIQLEPVFISKAVLYAREKFSGEKF